VIARFMIWKKKTGKEVSMSQYHSAFVLPKSIDAIPNIRWGSQKIITVQKTRKKRTFEENYYAHKIDTLPYHSSYMVAKIGSYILIIDIDYSWKKLLCYTVQFDVFFPKRKSYMLKNLEFNTEKRYSIIWPAFLQKKSSIFGPLIKIHTV